MSLFKNIVAFVLFCSVFFCCANEATTQEQTEINISIVDSAGKPVPKVSAYWFKNGKSKKLTAHDGVVTVTSAEGLIVARSEQHHCSGIVLHKKTEEQLRNASVVLRTPSEPGRILKTLPVPVSTEQKTEIIKQVLDIYWAQLKSNPKDPANQMSCFELLGALDPQNLNEFVDSIDFDVRMKAMGKSHVVKSLAQSDPELAIEIADSIEDPMSRSGLIYALLTHLPENSPHVEAVEEQYIETIKAISQPAFRYAIWSSLGEYYFCNGKEELTDKIVEENLSEVRKLPDGGWAAYPKSCFAALIVEEKPDLALEMIEGCKGHERPRALGRLAFHCCQTNPNLAIELLGKIENVKNAINTAENQIKIAYRMAGPQTDSAFEVAGSIMEANQRAWAWGLIASKLAKTDSVRAKNALENAIQAISVNAPGKKSLEYFSEPTTLAGLLPIVETVAPEKVESVVWEAVWLTIPRSRWNMGGDSKDTKRQSVAAAVSRYDRELANAMMGDTQIVVGMDPSRAAVTQVALDAGGVPKFLERLNKGPRFSAAFHPRAKVAQMLSGSDEEFWDEVSLPAFLEWPTVMFEEH
ncbi:MAG: hypothetical protein AB8B55_17320 [Mariniblastus sp.]